MHTLPKGRIEWLDAAKIVALICLIVTHTESHGVMEDINIFLLPVFWVGAGYTSIHGFSLRRRFRKIIVPYFVMTAICVVYTAIATPYWHWSKRMLLGILYARYEIFPGSPDVANILLMLANNSVLWFLPSLFTAYALLKVILMSSGKIGYQGVIAAIMMLLSVVIFPRLPILLPWSLDTALFIAPMMWCGTMLRRSKVLDSFSLKLLLLALSIFLISNHYAGGTNYSIRLMGHNYPASFLTAVSGSIVWYELFILLRRTKVIEMLSCLNSQALYIFGLQLIFLSFTLTVFTCFDIALVYAPIVQVPVAVCGGYLAGNSLTRLTERLSELLRTGRFCRL